MTDKLKPCPFCNGKAKLSEKTECVGFGETTTFHFVKCTNCGVTGKKFDRLDADTKTEQKLLAVLSWNGRNNNDR